MKAGFLLKVITGMLMFAASAVLAHDVPNIDHTHAFQQTGYGSYRQGHYVNGPNGSIIIWSAKPYTGYQSGSNVKFARPRPITKAPSGMKMRRGIAIDPATDYGRTSPGGSGN